MKAYTDIEQSKKLAEILPLESADMYYPHLGESQYGETPRVGNASEMYSSKPDIPCWSLAALLDYLSANFRVDIKYLDNHWEIDCRVRVAYNKELVDACCELLLKLHKQNIL